MLQDLLALLLLPDVIKKLLLLIQQKGKALFLKS